MADLVDRLKAALADRYAFEPVHRRLAARPPATKVFQMPRCRVRA